MTQKMNQTLFLNGRIHTGDPILPECTAVAVWGDKIVALGSTRDLTNQFSKFEQVDLGGKRVLPAFTDAHTHFLSYCLKQKQIDLNGINSLEKCLDVIRKKTQETSKGQWVKGGGWNQNLWSPVRYPTRYDLDRISSDHPVCLESRDAHTSWVNSRALAMAGITKSTTFDSTGAILKDEHNEPVGIMKEEARNLVWKVMGEENTDERVEALRNGLNLAYQNGLSGVHCMETIKDFEAYQILNQRNELKLRVNFYLPIRYLGEIISIGMKSGLGDAYVRFAGMKIFLDGTLGSQTAHMLEPFEHSDNYGMELMDQKAVNDLVLKAAQNDVACAIHAIGDHANRKALNAFENQKNLLPGKQLRQRIEHCQLIHPEDIIRFGKLGVVASMQPVQISEDIDAANRYWAKRARYAYPFRSLIDSGATVAFGSDVPIETCNIFDGIYAALKRSKRGESSSWYPEESLALNEIIKAYTIGPAYASGEEKIKGSISVGKLADMMVLSNDILECPPEQILESRVVVMIVGGENVYSA
jgi:predicted amidohydrolase YtcJ